MVYPFLPGSQSKPSRRSVIQAGVLGVLGLGMGHVRALRALAEGTSVDGSSSAASEPRAKAVIYIFLSGGLSQLDSFDPKPDAPVQGVPGLGPHGRRAARRLADPEARCYLGS